MLKICSEQSRLLPITLNRLSQKTAIPLPKKDLIKFAEVARHNEGLFEILRVEGSAYSWRAQSQTRDDGTTDWFMQIVSDADKRPIITAETVAYLGLKFCCV